MDIYISLGTISHLDGLSLGAQTDEFYLSLGLGKLLKNYLSFYICKSCRPLFVLNSLCFTKMCSAETSFLL